MFLFSHLINCRVNYKCFSSFCIAKVIQYNVMLTFWALDLYLSISSKANYNVMETKKEIVYVYMHLWHRSLGVFELKKNNNNHYRFLANIFLVYFRAETEVVRLDKVVKDLTSKSKT